MIVSTRLIKEPSITSKKEDQLPLEYNFKHFKHQFWIEVLKINRLEMNNREFILRIYLQSLGSRKEDIKKIRISIISSDTTFTPRLIQQVYNKIVRFI